MIWTSGTAAGATAAGAAAAKRSKEQQQQRAATTEADAKKVELEEKKVGKRMEEILQNILKKTRVREIVTQLVACRLDRTN